MTAWLPATPADASKARPAVEEMLLCRERLFVTAGGTPSHEPTEDCAPLVADWKNIVYDMLYGEQYITRALTEPPGS